MLFSENISVSFKNGLPSVEFKDRSGRVLNSTETNKKIFNRIYNYFLDLELFILRVIGFVPFYFVRYIFYIAAGVKIGSKSHIHMGTQFFNPENIVIGEGTIIGQNAFLDGRDKLKIGSHVDIASDVMIYNSEHDIQSSDFHPILDAVEIGDYCFIGPRAIILAGVKVGKGAVVAAGAVVTKDIPEFSIAGGVPAKVIGERQIKDPSYKLGRARLFQ